MSNVSTIVCHEEEVGRGTKIDKGTKTVGVTRICQTGARKVNRGGGAVVV